MWHVSGSAEHVRPITFDTSTQHSERKEHLMSDGFDGGFDASHVDAGEQHYDLDHGHQEFGSDQSHSVDANAYGEANNYENDQHLEQGHAVEYDNPNGAHYAEQDYTNYDGHEAASSASFGQEFSSEDHSQQAGEFDHLREQFDAAHFNATSFDNDGGSAEISAVSN
jgi:hypothetical protein